MPKLTSNKLLLSACCVTHGVQDGLSSSVYVMLPILAQHFGLGYMQIGLIRATHSGAMWLLEIPAGILSERFGERRLLVLGLVGAGNRLLRIIFCRWIPRSFAGLVCSWLWSRIPTLFVLIPDQSVFQRI